MKDLNYEIFRKFSVRYPEQVFYNLLWKGELVIMFEI